MDNPERTTATPPDPDHTRLLRQLVRLDQLLLREVLAARHEVAMLAVRIGQPASRPPTGFEADLAGLRAEALRLRSLLEELDALQGGA
jgi:hypothetical protein